MIAFSEVLADAYVRPARNIAMPSMPGRQVKFLQGHALIKDGRDLAAMLRRPDVKIVLREYALSWIDEISRAAGQVRAELVVPWLVTPTPTTAATTAATADTTPPAAAPRPLRGPAADPNWPRDPLTHRFLKQKLADGADRPEPGS